MLLELLVASFVMRLNYTLVPKSARKRISYVDIVFMWGNSQM